MSLKGENMTSTAVAQYKETKKEVSHLTRDLLFKIEKHAEQFKKEDFNWAMVGDLEHVKTLLTELNTFLK